MVIFFALAILLSSFSSCVSCSHISVPHRSSVPPDCSRTGQPMPLHSSFLFTPHCYTHVPIVSSSLLAPTLVPITSLLLTATQIFPLSFPLVHPHTHVSHLIVPYEDKLSSSSTMSRISPMHSSRVSRSSYLPPLSSTPSLIHKRFLYTSNNIHFIFFHFFPFVF